VKEAFGASASTLGPYDKKGAGQNWPKTNNWRAALHMTKADLEATDLGEFLSKL
jgi:hypothetical protein